MQHAHVQIEAALLDHTVNGIPQHLLARHANIMARYGAGAESLKRKAFPTAGQISKWGVQHSHAASGSTTGGSGI